VDLAGAPGSPVLAAGDGVVAFAGMVAGRPVVSVDHVGGLRTTYEPVQPSVGAGQAVARGSPLGTLMAGHTGCPAAACLHWGLRRGQDYRDPLLLLRPQRVRLLPLHRSAALTGNREPTHSPVPDRGGGVAS
jgi:murein DD-endopeptidase MepM/ murein hydrolase activator NlpD